MSNTTPRFSLPMYFPSTFVLDNAVLFAQLVNTAYDQFNQWSSENYPTPQNFQWTPHGPSGMTYSTPLWADVPMGLNFSEPFGFLAWDSNGNYYLALRGSMTSADFYNDAKIDQTPYTLVPNYGNVHIGFNDIYTTLSPTLLALLNSHVGNMTNLFITAHSLGSGLSTLAVPDIVVNSGLASSKTNIYHYNFASPRVGDPQFAYMTNELTVPTFRIVNTEDVVPDGPLAVQGSSTIYKHVGTPVDFTAQYDSIDGNHSMLNCYAYAINNPNQPEGPIVQTPNVTVGTNVGTLMQRSMIQAQTIKPVSSN